MSLPLVSVFAKWPEPGRVKTRLCPPLTPEEAAELATAFLLDRMESLRQCPGLDAGIAFSPDEARGKFTELFPSVPLRPQGEGDLGARMSRAIAEGLAEGRPAAILVGADAPLLPVSLIEEAAEALMDGECDLALAPSEDGGYSMIGLSKPQPELFCEMPWSTPDVLGLTLRRAESLGLRVFQTAPAPDCDTPADLRRLKEARKAQPETFVALAPRTAAFLKLNNIG